MLGARDYAAGLGTRALAAGVAPEDTARPAGGGVACSDLAIQRAAVLFLSLINLSFHPLVPSFLLMRLIDCGSSQLLMHDAFDQLLGR